MTRRMNPQLCMSMLLAFGVTALTESRNLEQEQWNNVQWVNDDQYFESESNSILSNWTKQAQEMGDRVDEDLAQMWQTAPSSWIAEYWEVFAIFMGIIVLVVSCYCALCCSCCCSNPTDRRVMDADEYKSYQSGQTKGTFGDEPTTQFVKMEDKASKTIIPKEDIEKVKQNDSFAARSITNSESALLSGGDDETAKYDMEVVGSKVAPKKTNESNVFMEIVDVWSEFLVQQFDRVGRSSSHRRKRESDYRRRNSEHQRDASYRSKRSPRNGSSSRRPPRNSQPRVVSSGTQDSLDIL